MKILKILSKIFLVAIVLFSLACSVANFFTYKKVHKRLCVVESVSCMLTCGVLYPDSESETTKCTEFCLGEFNKCMN